MAEWPAIPQLWGIDLASGPDMTVEWEFNRITGEYRIIKESHNATPAQHETATLAENSHETDE